MLILYTKSAIEEEIGFVADGVNDVTCSPKIVHLQCESFDVIETIEKEYSCFCEGIMISN